MGADLIVGFLEIEKDQEPDWAAAKAVLDAITLDEAWDIVESVEQFSSRDDMGERFGPKTRLEDAYESVKAGWEGMNRVIVKLYGARTVILLTGDTSWGDPIEEVTNIEYFDGSGMAKAAGFIQ